MNDSSGIQEARKLYAERMAANDKAEAEMHDALDKILEDLTMVASIEQLLELVRAGAAAVLVARRADKAFEQARSEYSLRDIAS